MLSYHAGAKLPCIARCQTGAYAVGNQLLLLADDATTVAYKQIVIAMGESARAALSAFNHLIRSTPVEVKEVAQGRIKKLSGVRSQPGYTTCCVHLAAFVEQRTSLWPSGLPARPLVPRHSQGIKVNACITFSKAIKVQLVAQVHLDS